MTRLIDADALKNDLKQYFTDGVLDGVSAKLAFNQILHDIDNAPTVDIPTELCKGCRFLKDCETCEEKLRPQGEWIFLGDNPNRDNPNPNHKWSCNKCGRGVKEQENFCPNCGADMRGTDNG